MKVCEHNKIIKKIVFTDIIEDVLSYRWAGKEEIRSDSVMVQGTEIHPFPKVP